MINKIIWMAVGAAVYHFATKNATIKEKVDQLDQNMDLPTIEDVKSNFR